MMEFALLASGSKGNSFVIVDEDSKVMIDCGTTKKHLLASLEKTGVRKEELDAVVVTHDHSDHVSQIRHFADTAVYSPVDLPDVDIFAVRPLQQFTIGSLRFTPLALSHDARNTTGYIIESGTEKLIYITDTGYVNRKYFPYLQDADYIIMESNHDVGMLMKTRRPQYLKARIYSDEGHLNNEDCAEVLSSILTPKTKMVILAHISQEANTREKALQATVSVLRQRTDTLHPDLIVSAAGQFEMIRKGMSDEKTDPGTVSWTPRMERMADGKAEQLSLY